MKRSMTILRNSRSAVRRRGFTLLELLVVVAILAVLAGGIIASYDGLDGQAADSVITFNIKGVDQAIRQFTAINKTAPNAWDSLLFTDDDSGTDGEFLNIVSDELTDHLATTTASTLTANDVASLNAAGITTAMYVSGTAGGYDNSTTLPPIPNRVFDLAISAPGTAYGVQLTLVAGMQLPMVADATLLYQAAKLPIATSGAGHRVVALGVGNNATLVGASNAAGLSEAPFSGEVARSQYGRFIALYHLASDTDADGNFDTEEYQTARLVAVIDPSGHHFDEAYAASTGQHSDD